MKHNDDGTISWETDDECEANIYGEWKHVRLGNRCEGCGHDGTWHAFEPGYAPQIGHPPYQWHVSELRPVQTAEPQPAEFKRYRLTNEDEGSVVDAHFPGIGWKRIRLGKPMRGPNGLLRFSMVDDNNIPLGAGGFIYPDNFRPSRFEVPQPEPAPAPNLGASRPRASMVPASEWPRYASRKEIGTVVTYLKDDVKVSREMLGNFVRNDGSVEHAQDSLNFIRQNEARIAELESFLAALATETVEHGNGN